MAAPTQIRRSRGSQNPANPTQTRRRGRWSLILGTLFAFTAFAAVAYADDISNNLDVSPDAVAEIMPLNVGGTNGTTILYVIEQGTGKTPVDGKSGCNLAGTATLVLSVSSSDTTVATVSPSSVTFTSCTETKSLTVTPVSQGSATISVTQTNITTPLTYNLAPATFVVNVAPPPNTAPSIEVTGVDPGASYDKGSVPTATCQVTDAEDGNSSFAATLSAITGLYASDGIGSQTASCSYTDAGGLTASGSEIYSIVDRSPPTIAYTLDPASPDGSNGWYRNALSLTWTVTENESPGSLIKTGCVDQNITVDQAATTYSCSATSAGGSAGPVAVTVKRDGSAPSVVYTSADPAANAAGWHKTDVVATFTATDSPSGFSALALLTQTGTNTASGEGTSVAVGSPAFTDWAGNTAPAGEATVAFKIDKTAPTISGSASPPANLAGWRNSDVTVSWACGDALSGIASCPPNETLSTEGSALSASGTAIDVAGNSGSATVSPIKIDKTAPTVTCDSPAPVFGPGLGNVTASVSDALSGAKQPTIQGAATNQNGGTVSLTGQDQADNASAPVSCAYHVVRGGFLAPINGPPVLNVAKWGRVVPVKFNLIYDGVAVSDATASVSLVGAKVNCSTTTEDAVEVYEAAGSANSGSAFRYTDPHWTYNLDTGGFTVNACYRLDVKYLNAIAGSYLLKVTK